MTKQRVNKLVERKINTEVWKEIQGKEFEYCPKIQKGRKKLISASTRKSLWFRDWSNHANEGNK